MSREFSVVTASYSVETITITTAPGVVEHGDRPLPWRQIGVGTAIGAALGLVAAATTVGMDSLPVAIGCAIDVAAGGAILGGLWGATFFATDED
jgi:hypothetical protein